jgi:hypothetical protein
VAVYPLLGRWVIGGQNELQVLAVCYLGRI